MDIPKEVMAFIVLLQNQIADKKEELREQQLAQDKKESEPPTMNSDFMKARADLEEKMAIIENMTNHLRQMKEEKNQSLFVANESNDNDERNTRVVASNQSFTDRSTTESGKKNMEPGQATGTALRVEKIPSSSTQEPEKGGKRKREASGATNLENPTKFIRRSSDGNSSANRDTTDNKSEKNVEDEKRAF